MQNMFTLHELGLGSLPYISVQDRNPSPSLYLSLSPEIQMSHYSTAKRKVVLSVLLHLVSHLIHSVLDKIKVSFQNRLLF